MRCNNATRCTQGKAGEWGRTMKQPTIICKSHLENAEGRTWDPEARTGGDRWMTQFPQVGNYTIVVLRYKNIRFTNGYVQLHIQTNHIYFC